MGNIAAPWDEEAGAIPQPGMDSRRDEQDNLRAPGQVLPHFSEGLCGRGWRLRRQRLCPSRVGNRLKTKCACPGVLAGQGARRSPWGLGEGRAAIDAPAGCQGPCRPCRWL